MTHTSTEQERAEFEAWASDNGKWPKAIERDSKGDYLLLQTATGWMWWQEAWQAASRAPVVPQVTDEMIEAANEAYCPFGDMHLAIQAALAAAPQPPESAPVQMPEPVAYVHVPATVWNGEVRPVVSFQKYEGDHADGVYSTRTPLYTEQQVRQLLATNEREVSK